VSVETFLRSASLHDARRALWVWFSSCANSGTTSANAHQQSAHAALATVDSNFLYLSAAAVSETELREYSMQILFMSREQERNFTLG
jgi:hypothetical protein